MPKPKSLALTTDNHKQQDQHSEPAPSQDFAIEPIEPGSAKLQVLEIITSSDVKNDKLPLRVDGKNSKKTTPLSRKDVRKMAKQDNLQLELTDVSVTARALPGLLRILSERHTISISVDAAGYFVCTAKIIADTKPKCIIRIDANKIGSLSNSKIIKALTDKPVGIEKHLIISGITYMPKLKLNKDDEITEENDDAFLKLLRDPHITSFELSNSLLSEAATELLNVRIGRIKKLKKVRFENVDFATQAQRINFFKRMTLHANLTEIILRQCGFDDDCISQGGDFLKALQQLKTLDLSGNLLSDKILEKIAHDFKENYSITTIELGKTLSAELQKILDRNKELATFQENVNALQKTVKLVEQALSDIDKLDVSQHANGILEQLENAIKLYQTCFAALVREENFDVNKAIISDARKKISDIFTRCVAISLQRPYVFCVKITEFIDKMSFLLSYRLLMPSQWLTDATRIYFLNNPISRSKFDYASLCIDRLHQHDRAYIKDMTLLCYEGVITDYIAARKGKVFGVGRDPSLMNELMSKLLSDQNMRNIDGAKIMLQCVSWFLQDDILPGISSIKKENKDTSPDMQFDETQINPIKLCDFLQQIVSIYESKPAYRQYVSRIKDQLLPLAQQVVSIMLGEKYY